LAERRAEDIANFRQQAAVLLQAVLELAALAPHARL